MSYPKLEASINAAWENRNEVTVSTKGKIRNAVDEALNLLDSGTLRVAEKIAGEWTVNEWVKKAVLLSFRLNPNRLISHGPSTPSLQNKGVGVTSYWYDKVPSKFLGWDEYSFKTAGFRAVPGALVRHSAYIAPDVVLMPSFVNVGAYVGKGTMIDTWSTVGSCAQIGANCHISGGVGIGGVLEPLQASPVIIEDNCFIGARSEVAEGVVVEEGSVISMGVFLGASTKIVDRETGEIFYGRVPAYSVVVPGTLPPLTSPLPTVGVEWRKVAPSLSCAVIVKRVDEKTRSKTSINELLRA